ncbi:MAG: CinA family nicotinamide mononucleotide deamidase-related protein [Sphaerobacter sp.]|nr:CinA family nicotinamide mononucleotide deamidase-related protein [Sphaerobacter sp.]
MRAVVISVGSELIDGFLTDTNATYLAQEMAALGIELVGVRQVGDSMPRIVTELRRAWEDAELIVTTGGIGPTEDDLTRESIAALLGEEVRADPDLLQTIANYFASRGLTMPERNAKQAWLIPSAEPLANPMGTAPGWFVRRDGHVVVSMPGVPREMMRMWREQVVPRLAPYLGDRVVVARTLKTIGIGESAAERLIVDIIQRGYPIIGTYAKDDGVHIRITASARERAAAEAAVEATEREIRELLGEYIYGEDDTSLGAAILAPLVASGHTLAVVEDGSGGRTAALLAEEPAAIVAYDGGVVRAFEHAAAQAGIDPHAPDGPVALAEREAVAIRDSFRADYGLAIAVRLTAGATLDDTRGEVALTLVGPERTHRRQHEVKGIPREIRRRAGLWTAEFLWMTFRSELGGRG